MVYNEYASDQREGKVGKFLVIQNGNFSAKIPKSRNTTPATKMVNELSNWNIQGINTKHREVFDEMKTGIGILTEIKKNVEKKYRAIMFYSKVNEKQESEKGSCYRDSQ